ncbi:MAG: two-component sensor histidine kinase [Deltaproteobacteria bacterium]|nr:two-component sensor histidine kinase [Deltaproteobacteria bacterium]
MQQNFPLATTLGVWAFMALTAIIGATLLLTGYVWGGTAVWLWAALAYFLISRYASQTAAAVQQGFVTGEQLLQAQKLAALGELAAGLAHEINNPLAIIRQEAEYAQFVLKKSTIGDSPELLEVRDSLREIITQVDRSREITQNLLNFARKREPVLQQVEINRLIEDMVRLVEKEARNKNIHLQRHYDPDLPVVTSDPPLLRQVILNLLNNASYAIGADGEITVATRTLPNREILITVADTGPGIAPEVLPKIFDPFFTTKPQGKGTGLGLAICHGIIQKLGGRISSTSEPGRGATFAVTLPLSAQSQEQPA